MLPLYERIDKLCKDSGTNITQMCKEAGVQRSALSDYKSGKNKTISFANLQKIADFFKMTVDELVNGETKKSPDTEMSEDDELNELMEELKIADVDYMPCKDNSIYHPGRAAYLYVNGQQAGVFGELHPTIADNYGVEDRVYIAEISVDTLVAVGTGAVQVKPLPKFPASTRDMAVIVAEDVAASDLEKAIRGAGSELLDDVKIFDVYQGGQIAEGYKSIAFALTFQADRTLTVEEVSVEYDKIFAVLEEKFNAAMRA